MKQAKRNPQRKKKKPSGAKKNNPWQDHYARRAQKEHYPARSVYKLQEILQKHSLIKKGHKIMDLGCAPGSWLIYAAQLTGDTGRVVGIDLSPVKIQVPPQVQIITADVFSLDTEALGKDFNVILSDMAPATTGHKALDAARSFNLCETALAIALKVLVPGGHFICKIFQGADFEQFREAVRAAFNEQRIFKPQSSRKASREIFIIGIGKKALV